jgi:hypothetical protein
MFRVQKKLCSTCIYRPDSKLDLAKLEDDVRDPHVGFAGFRVCHHAPEHMNVCCRGFWNAHKDEFQAGQIAQRLGVVVFIEVDRFKPKGGKPSASFARRRILSRRR